MSCKADMAGKFGERIRGARDIKLLDFGHIQVDRSLELGKDRVETALKGGCGQEQDAPPRLDLAGIE